MTEILFYHLQNMNVESVLPSLLEKSLQRGWRAVVQTSSEERAEVLDGHLWTYRDDSFLPHTTWRTADAHDQPVVIAAADTNPNEAHIRFLVDCSKLPGDAERYERVVLMFDGDDEDAVVDARAAWKDGKAKGFTVTYWQADRQGRWQRRE
jgi:DNA polymerase-3 subunit chi